MGANWDRVACPKNSLPAAEISLMAGKALQSDNVDYRTRLNHKDYWFLARGLDRSRCPPVVETNSLSHAAGQAALPDQSNFTDKLGRLFQSLFTPADSY